MYLKKRMLLQQCLVNGTAQLPGYCLRPRDCIEIELDRNAPTAMTPEPLSLTVLYEDEWLIVVDKPAGMLVHPSRDVKSGTLANALAHHFGSGVRPGFVHRLDQATSGVLLVAKSSAILTHLARDFQSRMVGKQYLARVAGVVAHDQMIDAPIGRDGAEQPPWNVRADGKSARSRLRVLEQDATESLLELEPLTGRTNQLRIHCAHIGHPIVGDAWYGGAPASRLMLHAWRLTFTHPILARALTLEAPRPF